MKRTTIKLTQRLERPNENLTMAETARRWQVARQARRERLRAQHIHFICQELSDVLTDGQGRWVEVYGEFAFEPVAAQPLAPDDRAARYGADD